MQTIYLEPAQVPAHLKGGYTGKMFRAEVCETVTIHAQCGTWSGGSRETYHGIELATGKTVPASDNVSAPWDKERKDKTITLRSGFAIVKATMFCGKDLGLTFFVHPDDAVKLLPEPDDAVTDTERKVLAIIGGIKSGYRADYYRKAQISDAELEAIKASLIKRGYLTKVGAITPKGRNARGNAQPY